MRFRRLVWRVGVREYRDFPWRHTHDPYRTAVSEIMLQQTQAARVVPKYRALVRRLPTWRSLAHASAGDVLKLWSGLGYNRRALALRNLARVVVRGYRGRLPRSQEALEALPAIGPATAAAVRAFAFGEQSVYLDTNVRGVYIHEFFPRTRSVRDADIVPLVEQTFVRGRARTWYYALLDYGAWLKANRPNPTRRSAHVARASKFEGSTRQLRGRIVAVLLAEGTLTPGQVAAMLGTERRRVQVSLAALERDGLLRLSRGVCSLAR